MIILSTTVVAQSTDVDGWNGVKWGMDVAQVRLVIASPIERDSHLLHGQKVSPVFRTAKPLRMMDIPVWGGFLFSPNDKLISVELRVDGAFLDANRSQSELFGRLKQSLLDKYGKPTFTDENGRTVVWTLPSTSIRLQWTELAGHPFMAVTYNQADKKLPS
jgi:hypothetical protein